MINHHISRGNVLFRHSIYTSKALDGSLKLAILDIMGSLLTRYNNPAASKCPSEDQTPETVHEDLRSCKQYKLLSFGRKLKPRNITT